jgi:hypothetical protein
MIISRNTWTSITVGVALVIGMTSPVLADPGLLLVAHGSPNPQWNEPVLKFGRAVGEAIGQTGKFQATRIAMLEAVQPDIPTAVAELEAAGCDRIIVVPLFIAPSGHTHFDVPAVLGIYSSQRTAAVLKAEGASPARPRVPITLTETISESDVLVTYAADQASKLSVSPEKEALVFLAHGDPDHARLVEKSMRRIVTGSCGATGIGYGDWASIGVGQGYESFGIPAIQAAFEHAERVVVIGIYLSSSAASIHARHQAVIYEKDPTRDPLASRDVVFSNESLIDHPALLQHVVTTALAAREGTCTPNSSAVTKR